MRFFFDNCLSPHLAHGLRELAKYANHEVQHLKDRFPADTPDVDWINTIPPGLSLRKIVCDVFLFFKAWLQAAGIITFMRLRHQCYKESQNKLLVFITAIW